MSRTTNPSPSSDPPALRARELDSAAVLADAEAWLDRAEARAGVPLVDETERDRLNRALSGEQPERWTPLAVVREDGDVVGYGAVVLPSEVEGDATGDVAVDTDAAGVAPARIRSAALRALRRPAAAAGIGRVEVWMRHVAADHLDDLEQDGFEVARRLAILGRSLDEPIEVPEVAGATVRGYVPDRDDDAVVEILALAYEGTGDGGWTHERFAARRELPWFRAEDLLLAEVADDRRHTGRVLGLHWLKRRGGGVGEVYNLAIHPDGQGRHLGALLLAAGLAHLRAVGCHEVLLWVDRANERAVALYESRGFATRWEDVALESDLRR